MNDLGPWAMEVRKGCDVYVRRLRDGTPVVAVGRVGAGVYYAQAHYGGLRTDDYFNAKSWGEALVHCDERLRALLKLPASEGAGNQDPAN